MPITALSKLPRQSLNPHSSPGEEMASLDSCLRGISASMHTIAQQFVSTRYFTQSEIRSVFHSVLASCVALPPPSLESSFVKFLVKPNSCAIVCMDALMPRRHESREAISPPCEKCGLGHCCNALASFYNNTPRSALHLNIN